MNSVERTTRSRATSFDALRFALGRSSLSSSRVLSTNNYLQLLRFIPHPVMVGFCNGLGIIIGLAQFASFKQSIPISEGRRSLMKIGGSFDVFSDGVPWIVGGERTIKQSHASAAS